MPTYEFAADSSNDLSHQIINGVPAIKRYAIKTISLLFFINSSFSYFLFSGSVVAVDGHEQEHD